TDFCASVACGIDAVPTAVVHPFTDVTERRRSRRGNRIRRRGQLCGLAARSVSLREDSKTFTVTRAANHQARPHLRQGAQAFEPGSARPDLPLAPSGLG